MNKTLVFVINVDWYFRLHWIDRAVYFKKQGYLVHIVTNFTDNSLKEELSSLGFICHHLPLQRKKINLFSEIQTIYYLKSILGQINPSLIHCVTIKANIYSGLINRYVLKRPIVYGVTGLGAVFSSRLLKFILLKKIVVSLYKRISGTKSKFIFENSEDLLLFEKAGVLKNNNGVVIKGAGIDLQRFLPSMPPCNRAVLFAARLLKDKGLHILIEAKDRLEKQGCYFVVNVAGIMDTDVSSAIPIGQIEKWAENGDINWLGNVKDMPSLIANNDIVCLPTTYGEGVPRILIEAASCQRAIVTTDVAGCREIVSHGFNGLLAIPNDSESLAECLKVLLENKDMLIQYGSNGRKKVEQEFSQEMVFKETLEVYLNLSEP